MNYKFYLFIFISCLTISFQELSAQQLVPKKVTLVSRVTGQPLAGESIPNPNNTPLKYDVAGTDLGIMWKMGNNKTGVLFGDTFGGKNWVPGDDSTHWRSNVLAFSSDNKLNDGLSIDEMVLEAPGKAKEIIYAGKDKSGQGNWTSIPTAAIRVNGIDYIHYMNVQNWGKPGHWTTNYSGFAKSEDDGITWELTGKTFSGPSNFAQCALTEDDNFVYLLGTTSGRWGDVYLARWNKGDCFELNKCSYWNAGSWMPGEKNATPLFKGPAGELSVMYNTHFKKWIAVYLSEPKRALVLRSADKVEGPWSDEVVLLDSGNEYAGLYGGYIHPSTNDSTDLYFLVSLWGKYNVFLMHAELMLKN